MTDQDPEQSHENEPRWQPLSPRQRRVVAVLVEKAKTTPDAYPMTLNALTNGCNQKSNRSPQMNLSSEEVQEALEELRLAGAVAEVQSGGRVAKHRHLLYDWLGVDKVELAVMAELLLRGEQTLGELRARAARMEPIADLSALRPVVQSLMEKGLVVALSPEGRGQIVTHALHKQRELDELENRVVRESPSSAPVERSDSSPQAELAQPKSPAASTDAVDQLRIEVADLRAEIDQLRIEIDQLARSSKGDV